MRKSPKKIHSHPLKSLPPPPKMNRKKKRKRVRE